MSEEHLMFFNQNLEGVYNTLKADMIGMYFMHYSAILKKFRFLSVTHVTVFTHGSPGDKILTEMGSCKFYIISEAANNWKQNMFLTL